MSTVSPISNSDWPHRLAVVLVCATFPLIWVGGLVTTTQAGMAVPDWPSTYGYNLFLYPISTWLSGPWDLFIEHGHRLLGALVGLITIGVTLAVWRCDDRHEVRVLSWLTLAAVIGQGVLGGMRVLLDQRTLAKIHGCTGPAFFALAVVLAVVTSRWWRETGSSSNSTQSSHGAGTREAADHAPPTPSARAFGLAALTPLLAYAQLVLGAQVRHIAVDASPLEFRLAVYFHLFMAAALTLQIVALLYQLIREKLLRQRVLRRPALVIGALIVVQLGLGGATWVAKYAWPGSLASQSWTSGYTIDAGGLTQAIIITSHVAVGSLILVNSLVLALRCAWLRYHGSLLDQSTVGSPANANESSALRFSTSSSWPVGPWRTEGAV